jgi:DNA-binding protein H-NS
MKMAGEATMASLDFDALNPRDRMFIARQIIDRLTVQELMEISDLAEAKRLEKLEDAKNQVIEKMKAEFEAIGLSYDEVMSTGGRKRRGSGRQLPVKYRSPEGETWSGRGRAPTWLQVLEEEGHNREEYLVQPE